MSLLHRRRSGRLWCSGEGSREGEKVLEKVLGIFGERPGQVRRVQQGFQRLASQQGKNKTLRLLGIPPKLIFLLIHNSRILHLGSNGEPFCTRKKERIKDISPWKNGLACKWSTPISYIYWLIINSPLIWWSFWWCAPFSDRYEQCSKPLLFGYLMRRQPWWIEALSDFIHPKLGDIIKTWWLVDD